MSNFTFKFGTLKTAEIKNSANGTPFARFALDAGKFTVYGISFDSEIIRALAETPEGEMVRAGGFMDAKTVAVEGGERTYRNLVTRWLKVGEGEPIKASKSTASDANDMAEVEADDLTAIKGVGAKMAAQLNALGYQTFAQLAAATPEERTVLDDEVATVKGALTRARVFEQAAEMAA